MTNPGDGAQWPRRFGLLAGSSVAARTAIILASVGGVSWIGFAVRAFGQVRPDTNKFDYYPSSGTVVYPPSSAWEWWTVGVGWLAAALLVWGAAMNVMRMMASRILIVIGYGLVTAYSIFSIVTDLNTRSRPVHNALCLHRLRDAGSNLHKFDS